RVVGGKQTRIRQVRQEVYHGSRYSALVSRGSDPAHHSDHAVLALGGRMSIPVAPSPALMPIESSASAVSLRSIFAGALAASAITLILTLIGSGLGLTMVSPWAGESVSLEAIGWTTVVWLILVQW